MSKPKKQKSIENYVQLRFSVLDSPAYRVLSLSGVRVLARILIELGRHGGKDNGRLPVTHADFIEYGIDAHSVGPAQREVQALGFAEITQRGFAGSADRHRPNMFRIAFMPTDDGPATDEWRLIATFDEARRIAKSARAGAPKRRGFEYRKPVTGGNISDGGFSISPMGVSPIRHAPFPMGVSPIRETKTPMGVSPTPIYNLSIYPLGAAGDGAGEGDPQPARGPAMPLRDGLTDAEAGDG
jgi:hypothetical protein